MKNRTKSNKGLIYWAVTATVLALVFLGIGLYQQIAFLDNDYRYKKYVLEHTSSVRDVFITNLTSLGIHDEVNEQRKLNGLPELNYNPTLETSACAKADDMIKKNYWDHVSPEGLQPWKFYFDVGLAYEKAGENLAYGFFDNKSLVKGWLDSETHRQNMFGDYHAEGICVRKALSFQNQPKQVLVVQHLYRP